jgi:hypothetical protein
VTVDEKTIATKDAWAIIDPFALTARTRGSYQDYESSLAKLSRGQRLMQAMQWYQIETSDGGHEQFYLSDSGIMWEDAQKGFAEIGAPQVAAIIDESAKRMGGRPPFNISERTALMERTHPNFDDLDKRRFNGTEDTDALMLQYIRSHPKDFLFDGEIERMAD